MKIILGIAALMLTLIDTSVYAEAPSGILLWREQVKPVKQSHTIQHRKAMVIKPALLWQDQVHTVNQTHTNQHAKIAVIEPLLLWQDQINW